MLRIGPHQPEDDRTTYYEIDGTKFTFKAKDPYGFITVYNYPNTTPIPGVYTNHTAARQGALKYYNEVILPKKRKKNG